MKNNDLESVKKEVLKIEEEIKNQRIERFKEIPLSINEKKIKEKNDLIFKNKTKNELPQFYDQLDDYKDIKKNVTTETTNYWSNKLFEHQNKETLFKRELKSKGFFRANWNAGKLGFDKYFIFFPIVIIITIPLYNYLQNKKKRVIYEKINPFRGRLDELEYSKEYDIDDFSKHQSFYNVKKIQKSVEKKLKLYQEIDDLEKELFSKKRF